MHEQRQKESNMSHLTAFNAYLSVKKIVRRASRHSKLVYGFLLYFAGGLLHCSWPDVHDDSSVLDVRRAGGCVCVSGTV